MLAATALSATGQGRERADFIVAANGQGDFRTIQEALNSVQSGKPAPVVILIRSGIYREKVFIQRSQITLVGEDRESTRIVLPVLREEWNKANGGSDFGAGVVNIDSGVSDITLANLTVYNNHGSLHGTYNKHQFAIRGAGTRIMLLYCNVISDGGDALSLWNKQNGMYYHAECSFEGWVDFVCPRGWCYITDSRFFGHNTSASIWHDGDYDKSQKFVIVRSRFDGVPAFPLGRHHRDGQFYLLYCSFSENMADKPIYHPPTSTTQWQWGARHYYYGCRRDGGDYSWFRDNLDEAEGSPKPEEITSRWTFDGRWDPEATMPSVLPFAAFPHPRNNAESLDTGGVTLRWIAGRNSESHNVYFGTSNPPPFQSRQDEAAFFTGPLVAGETYFWRVDEATSSGTVTGKVWSFTTQNR